MNLKLPLSKLAEPVRMLPQLTRNVRVADKEAVLNDGNVADAVKRISERLGRNGRILMRGSGTEPVVRIMVEAPSPEICEECVAEAADAIASVRPATRQGGAT